MSNKICVLPIGTGVYNPDGSGRDVVDYLESCGINNTYNSGYLGSDGNSTYGRGLDDRIRMENGKANPGRIFDRIITYKEFKALLAKPVDQIINAYEIW